MDYFVAIHNGFPVLQVLESGSQKNSTILHRWTCTVLIYKFSTRIMIKMKSRFQIIDFFEIQIPGFPVFHMAESRFQKNFYRRIDKCPVKLNEHRKVVTNYDALTADEKARVPNTSYLHSAQFVPGRPEYDLRIAALKAATPKN